MSNETLTGPILPAEPMLRIEVGQHTTIVNRLDIDREGRFLVTGSDDKTARVWALPEGRLLRVLRPPAGPGNEGKVYAVAISPDGATVAVGGWDIAGKITGHSVYLFDRESGRLLRRFGGLKDVIFHLAFSPGGKHLAASLGRGGVRVWGTQDWGEPFADGDYGSDSYGCTFDRAGRLATTCWDGLLRLYEPLKEGTGFRLVRKTQAPGGGQPNDIAFSPNGEWLAVGYYDTIAVSILSGTDLSPLFSPDTTGIDNGDLSSVAWSADGRFLYAAGRFQDSSDDCPILRWAEAGRGERTTLAAVGDSVMYLKPWGEEGVLFAAADPRFGGFNGKGEKHLDRGPETGDMRYKFGAAFTVSWDGRSVRFGLDVGEARPVRFDLDSRQVTTQAPADEALNPARTGSEGLTMEGWEGEDTTELRLNGKPLPLEQYETAHSVAIEPGGKRFILGADWSLRLFDREGALLWFQAVPGIVWGVNITSGGKLAIAAYDDGTVRWHRLEDGEELLALFVHPDSRRWIAWTPQGYYDAAAGADGLIGWQVNRGRDAAADFFPVWQFRQRFYRPDVVNRVLDTLDVAEALRQADDAAGRPPKPAAEAMTRSLLPPAIELLAPHDGAPFDRPGLTLTYLLRHAAGEVPTEMSALVDGRPERVTPRTVQRSEEAEVCQVTLQMPPHDANLSLAARAGDLEGRSATIQLRWRGEAPEPKPTLYLLAVGVSKYERYQPLSYADRDATDFAAAMRGQGGLMYEKVEMRTLPNEEATRAEIIDGLDWLMRAPTHRDIAMVFLSGHGLSDERRRYYFLPYDFDLARRLATGVKQADLTEALREIPAKKVLFFIDSCHAGGAGDTHFKSTDQADIDGLVNELKSAEVGVIVFASCTGTQVSQERPDWENGAFTEALLEGLAGKADYHAKKAITVKGLDLYLANRVKELTGGAQTPTTTMPDATPDFPIAAVT
jgi:WD40 repeat protein